MLISIIENFGEIQAIVMSETRGHFLNCIADYIFWQKKLIRGCSISMVTDLLKVLFGSFCFIHAFAVYLIFFALYVLIVNQ